VDGTKEGILVRLGLVERDGSFESLGTLEGGMEVPVGAGLTVTGAAVGVTVQVIPFPAKPGLQAQTTPLAVLVQDALASQGLVVAHKSSRAHVVPVPT